MDSSATSKPAINWYATCGKERLQVYPGKEHTAPDGKVYWCEESKPTREYIDKLRRPYGPEPIFELSMPNGFEYETNDEHDLAKRSQFYVPHKYIKTQEWEKAWDCPIDHKHHIFKFPTEILERILFFSVVHGEVQPLCVAQNEMPYSTEWRGILPQLPRYTTCPDYSLCRVLKETVKDEVTGQLVEQDVKIWKRTIDATVLRVCKTFHELGRKQLYGGNTFLWNIVCGAAYPPNVSYGFNWYDAGSNSTIRRIRRVPSRYSLEDENQDSIRNLGKDKNPADWTITDPFISFLRGIGPENASFIKHLKFKGQVTVRHRIYTSKLSNDRSNTSAEFNFLHDFGAYSIFIERYCPNLQSLELGIDDIYIEPYIHQRLMHHMAEYYEPGTTNLVEWAFLEEIEFMKSKEERPAFKSLLQEVIPKFKNLRELKVLTHEELRAADSQLPKNHPRKHDIDIFWERIREMDEEMVGDVQDEMAKAYRERNKHPELVAMNALMRQGATS